VGTGQKGSPGTALLSCQAWLTCGSTVGSGMRTDRGGAEASGFVEVRCEGR
jgi:hypothetical protein